MPQFGRLPASAVVAVSHDDGSPPPPWTMAGAVLQLVTFEVDADATLDLLPPMLSRPAPPYARVLIADYVESPIGPYREATLLLSCRYLMLPRQMVVGSVVTSESAQAANARNWHYPSEVGEVTLTREGASFVGRVRTASGLDLTVTSPDAQETGIATIRYDPAVVVQPGNTGLEVLTVSADPLTVHEAWLAQRSTYECRESGRQSAWWKLRSRNPITGTIARVDVERPVPSAVEPSSPGSGLP